jgi:hypothetical protein
VIRLELREGCNIFYRVLLSPAFSGRQRHVIYLLLYRTIMKRQEEILSAKVIVFTIMREMSAKQQDLVVKNTCI